ncbi:MAG: RdgB/HAM1 family non-canonical purine NTP pyrophosphatase [Angustibacter sp.]
MMPGIVRPDGARLVLATRNPHKVVELRQILAELPAFAGIDLERRVIGLDAGDGPSGTSVPQVVEEGTTFAANALLKARAVASATGVAALADDSGLAVDVLGGCPGIFSARWSGHHPAGTPRAEIDRANVELLLAQLADVREEDRAAGFVCAVALVTPSGQEHVEHGTVRGAVERAPRGDGGFGYDPVLRLEGDSRTLAELSAADKHAISHRGRAVRAIAPRVASLVR